MVMGVVTAHILSPSSELEKWLLVMILFPIISLFFGILSVS